jgi:hypothetical protein
VALKGPDQGALRDQRNQRADDFTRPTTLNMTQIKCIYAAIELPFPDTF